MGCTLMLPQINMETMITPLPSYFDHILVSEADLILCRKTWESILKNRTPTFLEMRNQSTNFPHQTCSDWFSALLYEKLFVCCPHARSMFLNDVSESGNHKLICMISKCILLLELIVKSYAANVSSTARSISPAQSITQLNSPPQSRSQPNSPSNSPSNSPARLGGSERCRSQGSCSSRGSSPDAQVLEGYSSSSSLPSNCSLLSNSSLPTSDVDDRYSTMRPSYSRGIRSDSCRSDCTSLSTTDIDVETADKVGKFSHIMKKIARSHYNFGVRSPDFCAFGEALLSSLRTVCGAMYTDEIDGAWRRLYSVMLHGVLTELPTCTIAEEDEDKPFMSPCQASRRPRSNTL